MAPLAIAPAMVDEPLPAVPPVDFPPPPVPPQAAPLPAVPPVDFPPPPVQPQAAPLPALPPVDFPPPPVQPLAAPLPAIPPVDFPPPPVQPQAAPLPAIPPVDFPPPPVPPQAALGFQESSTLECPFNPVVMPALTIPVPDAATGGPPASGPPASGPPTGGPPAGGDDRTKSPWLKNPPVQFFPHLGNFQVPPTGPGYYSLGDWLDENRRDKPPSFGYPRFAIMPYPMFDTDWRYVDQPDYQPDLLERLHRFHLGDDWMFATGGEFRVRYNNEINSRLTGKDNTYDLTRLRVFGDLWYRNTLRIYVEFLSAGSSNQTLPPTIFDRDQADFLNLFVDYKFFEDAAGVPWYVRGGRQQLLLGSERLVSPLDWVNTLRTFDGVRVFRHSQKLDIDAFWTRPVIPDPSGWSSSDPQQNFAGTWLEYRPTKNRMFDLYYLYYSDNDRYNAKTKTPPPVGQLPLAPYTVNTWGSRMRGAYPITTTCCSISRTCCSLADRATPTATSSPARARRAWATTSRRRR